MKREVWQDYDCPRTMIDFDLFDDQLVYYGQPIQCSACAEGVHLAGIDVEVQTGVDVEGGEREFHYLPRTAEELQKIKDGTF